jgi:hypothetical protein
MAKVENLGLTQEMVLGATILYGLEPVYIRVQDPETKRWIVTKDVRTMKVRVSSRKQLREYTIDISLRDYNTNELLVTQEVYNKILQMEKTVIPDMTQLVEFVGFEAVPTTDNTIRKNFNASNGDNPYIESNTAGMKITAKDFNLKQVK